MKRHIEIQNRSALLATLLAMAYAGVSAYWALGGRAGLRSVGGAAVRLAQHHTVQAFLVIWATVIVKVVCAALSYRLAIGLARTMEKRLNTFIAVILLLYGGALVGIAVLVETRVLQPSTMVDWYALKWHLLVWDSWFLVWGLLLLEAVIRSSHTSK